MADGACVILTCMLAHLVIPVARHTAEVLVISTSTCVALPRNYLLVNRRYEHLIAICEIIKSIIARLFIVGVNSLK